MEEVRWKEIDSLKGKAKINQHGVVIRYAKKVTYKNGINANYPEIMANPTKVKRGSTYYYVVAINKTNFYLHRLIWEYHFGCISKNKVIDHINGDGLDNRIENLRCVDESINSRNKVHKGKNPAKNIWYRNDCVNLPYFFILRSKRNYKNPKQKRVVLFSQGFSTLAEAIQVRNSKYKEFGFPTDRL